MEVSSQLHASASLSAGKESPLSKTQFNSVFDLEHILYIQWELSKLGCLQSADRGISLYLS